MQIPQEFMDLDILLVNTPTHDFSTYPSYHASYSTPVGLLSLATTLLENNIKTHILEADKLKLTPVEIADFIKGSNPKWVGLNVFTPTESIIKKIINLLGHSKIVLGGPHISGLSDKVLKERFPNVSFFIKGEGEFTLTKLVSGKLEYKNDDVNIFIGEFIPTLDVLPQLNRDLLNVTPYNKNGKKYADISMSRGCFYNCSFCFGARDNNIYRFRRRSNENVAKEIQALKNRGVECIRVIDDCAFFKKADLIQFMEDIKNSGVDILFDINIPFALINRLSFDDMLYLKKLGLYITDLGIESGSARIRKLNKKNLSEEKLIDKLGLLMSIGIYVKGYFIMGFPTETSEEMDLTLKLAKKLYHLHRTKDGSMFRPRIFVFKPFPGTEFWRMLLQQGFAKNQILDSFEEFHFESGYFNKHGWGTTLNFSEVPVEQIIDKIDDFYKNVDLNVVKTYESDNDKLINKIPLHTNQVVVPLRTK